MLKSQPAMQPRLRDLLGEFVKDPPLPEPYPGYSMMEMLKRERAHFYQRWQEPDPLRKKKKKGRF